MNFMYFDIGGDRSRNNLNTVDITVGTQFLHSKEFYSFLNYDY